jgi:small subunit ribosomal protein S17
MKEVIEEKSSRKVREGVVVSNKMEKTVTVRVERTVKHPRFDKVVARAKKYYAHAENSKEIPEGKLVRIVETRPLSKLKRWRVEEVLG